MKFFSVLGLLLITAAMMGGCDRDRMSERGFALPAGNAAAGRETFLYMQCNQCHSVHGETLPTLAGSEPFVELGGPVTRVKTYGELVTSIINPSHKLADGYPEDLIAEDGESRMYVYNGYMTIQELIDLVAYLQPFYDVIVPAFEYRVYP
jgi:mono/diheme cytochrome c family protein